MPRILMLTKWDWANTGYRFYKCLKQQLGLDVTFFKGDPHHFNYPEQAAIHTAMLGITPSSEFPLIFNVPALKPLVKQHDIIHFIASTLIHTGVDLRSKKVVVQHGGTTYRTNPENSNKVFNPIATKTIMQFPTLLNQGAVNEELIYYPVDSEFIKPDFKRKNPDKLIIGHFPSDWTAKGTKMILNVMEDFKNDSKYKDKFEYIGLDRLEQNRVSWLDNLDRLRQCDVVIETIKLDLRGMPFGEWGNTALESAALGNIVISNSLYVDIYKKEYKTTPEILITNDEETLIKNIKMLLELSDKEIYELKQKTRQWAEDKHSMKATAHRLWDKVYKPLIEEETNEETEDCYGQFSRLHQSA